MNLHKSIISVLNLLTLITVQFSDNILIAARVSEKRISVTPEAGYSLGYGVLKEGSKACKTNKQKPSF